MLQEMTHTTVDYRDSLREILRLKIRQNPRYSLRAFARDLGIAPSHLSEILNKKQGLSPSSARRISLRLKLSTDHAELFCNSAAALHARSPAARRMAEMYLIAKSQVEGSALHF